MRGAWFILALAALLPSCAPTPGGVTPPVLADRSNFEARILAVHNRERAAVGVPPLRWSASLTEDARGWAQTLMREGKLRHAPREVAGEQGENLWMGTRGVFTPEAMIDRFAAEKALYRHGVFPDVARSGSWESVGHYTQMVWRDTQEVGCALAEGRTLDFLVCRYSPAGNIEGQRAY